MNAERKRRVLGLLTMGLAGAALLLAAGLWGAERMAWREDANQRATLLDHAVAIARAVDPELVMALSFTRDDLANPAFLRLRGYLRAYAEAVGLRSLYTMAMRDGQIVFGPESLEEDDPYASPPGTVYLEPGPEDLNIFQSGAPFVIGPQVDEYGTFVSALAPVFHPQTGEVLLAVGIDVEADDWQRALNRARRRTLFLVAALLGLFLGSLLLLDWRDRVGDRRRLALRYAEVLVVALLGLALTVIVTWHAHQSDLRNRRNRFKELAWAHGASIMEEWRDLRSRVLACARFIRASEDVTREEFQTFAEPRAWGALAQGWSWIVRVPASEAAELEEAARAAGIEGFRIWQLDATGARVPAAGRDTFYPAFFIAPDDGLEGGFGHDMGSEPIRRRALEDALRTGLPTATEPLQLLALPGRPEGLFVFHAAHSRRRQGLVAVAVRLDEMITLALRRSGGREPAVVESLFQLEAGRPPRLLSTSHPDHEPAERCWRGDAHGGLHAVLPIFLFGKTYGLVAHAAPEWLAAFPVRAGRIVGASGLLLTALLAAFVGFLTRHRAALEAEVRLQTLALRNKSDELERFFSSSLDLLCIADMQGHFRRLNEEWGSALGYALSELEGHAFMDFVHPDDREPTLQAMGRLAQGREVLNFANRYRHKDGSWRWLEWRSIPAGDLIYSAARDVTEARRTREQLTAQLAELQLWQSATLGRESRILELKREVNELLARSGRAPKYGSAENGSAGQPPEP